MPLRHIALRCLPAFAALAVAACGGSGLTLPNEGLAAKIVIVKGDAQSATVSSVLPESLVVRVTDSRDQAVGNQRVDFLVDVGGGAVSPGSTTTSADGVARTLWTLGPTAGPQRVIARATGNSAPANLNVTFNASALTAAPAKLEKSAGDGQTAAAGAFVATPPAVKVTDAGGNPIQGVLVTFQVSLGGGTVTPTTPVSTNATGVAAATSWKLGTTAGQNQLTATVSATGVAGNPAVFNATGAVGGANRLVFIVQPVNAAVGAPITPAIKVQVQDAAGNPVSSATNPITISPGNNPSGAALSGTTTVNAVGGTATFADLSINKPGTGYTLAATSTSGLTGAISTAFDVVNASSTTTITNINPGSTVVGQPYIVTFTVAAAPPATGTPTGAVTVSDGAGATCTAQAPSGSCALTSTNAGAKSIVATYAGDANFAGSASLAQSHQVGPAATSVLITGDSPDPSIFGQTVTVTFSVTVNSPGSGTPTGNVLVTFGGTLVCQAPLSAGQCTFTPASIGTKNLKAAFVPATGDFSSDQSPNEGHTVDAAGTATTIASSLNPSSFGQSVSFTATVSPEAGGATPTGSVQVKIDGSNFGPAVILSAGVANSQSSSSLTPGTHAIEADYTPNTSGFTGSSGSLTQNVGGLIPTNLSLGTAPNPSTFGGAVTLTATVTSTLLTPTGSVSFFDGPCGSGASLGSDNLSAGGTGTATASISTSSLGAGQHSLSACYAGNGTFGASQDAQTQDVAKLATQTQVSSNNNPSTAGDNVTFTATVTAAVGTPDGTVTFRDGSCPDQGSDLSGAVTLTGGQAQFATAGLPGAATTTVFACYGGSTNYLSSSGSVDQVVN